MNYLKIYESIIEKVKSQNRKKLKKNNIDYIYFENHHIIPKCLGGNNDKLNLVLLTAREHFICHKLLTYIYKGNRKIICAFHYMTYGKTNKHNKSGRDYAYAIELMRITPISEETRKKQSKSRKGIKFSEEWKTNMKGKPPWNKRKHDIYNEETINNMQISHIGKKHTEKTKDQIGKSVSGDKNGGYGKDNWAITRNTRKICEYCNREFDPGNYKKWHGEKCKHKLIDL